MRTNKELRVMVAEELGWTEISTRCMWGLPPGAIDDGTENCLKHFPNYPLSLDACVEFEATLTAKERDTYIINLHESTGCSGFENDNQVHLEELHRAWILTTATPRQRCIAFLKTKGKL